MKRKIAIVGGGISGLAAAWYLESAEDVECTIFEAENHLGGKIRTATDNGFILEAGPDSFITQKPWGLALCKELGLEDELIPTNQACKTVFVFRNGKLHPFPMGFRLTIPTQMRGLFATRLLSWSCRMRMAMEPFIPPRKESGDESMADFVRRRFGQEALDIIAGPLMAGIYTGDPEQLSIDSTFPMFPAMEKKHGSLYKAMRRAPKPKPTSLGMFASLKSGLAILVTRLEEKLTCEVRTGHSVQALRRSEQGFELELSHGGQTSSQTFDEVILTLPAYAIASVLESEAPEAAEALREIPYLSTATVNFGYNKKLELPGFGFIVPRTEKREMVACSWSSTKFPGRAPEGHSLIRGFFGGHGREETPGQSDEALTELMKAELKTIMGLSEAPDFVQINRWMRSSPQYHVGHADTIARIHRSIEKIPGLHLAGNAYQGVGIPDSIRIAKEVAERVAKETPPA